MPNVYQLEVLEAATNLLITALTVQVVAVGGQGPAGAQGPIGIQGPQGIQGIPGIVGGTFTYQQQVSSNVWVIHHNIGAILDVVTIDSSGETVEGDVEYPDANTTIVTFTTSFSGTAYVG